MLLQIEADLHDLLAAGIMEIVEMEKRTDLDDKEAVPVCFPEELQTVVHSRAALSVIVDTVERVSQVQSAAIFDTGGVAVIVVRHHVHSIEQAVAHPYSPMTYLDIELPSIRENAQADVTSVVLHRLKPPESQ